VPFPRQIGRGLKEENHGHAGGAWRRTRPARFDVKEPGAIVILEASEPQLSKLGLLESPRHLRLVPPTRDAVLWKQTPIVR